MMRARPSLKKARLRGPFPTELSVTAMMPVVPVVAVHDHRLERNIGNARRNVEPGLALHADRLQHIGIGRPAEQEVAAEADADGRIGADAAVLTGQPAAPDRMGRPIGGPLELGLLGEAEIDAEAVDSGDKAFRTATFSLEH